MTTIENFLKSKPLRLNKDIYDGYNITYFYLNSLLNKYSKINSIEFVDFMEKYFFVRMYGTFVYISQLQGTTDKKQYSKEELYDLFISGKYNPEIK